MKNIIIATSLLSLAACSNGAREIADEAVTCIYNPGDNTKTCTMSQEDRANYDAMIKDYEQKSVKK